MSTHELKARLREQARDIGEDIDRIDRRAEGLGEAFDGGGGDVRFGRGGVLPEWEDAAAERALVVVPIRYEGGQRDGRTALLGRPG